MNAKLIPGCHYCKKSMTPELSKQIGYLMWKCKVCGHEIYEKLPGTRVIHGKVKQSPNESLHRTIN